ncbi:replicative DNA helicase (plasmid) [Deinococcus sp. VB142]|uniref:Replicative DNA helicase n=1 Tax=Deinococcus sp. VB142 TaxID=3112952 RepID=A0AAU6Q8R7_9DEIO
MNYDPVTARVPPHDNDAEVALLGSLMLDPEQRFESSVTRIRAEMFYREGHRKIFEAIEHLCSQTPPEPVDLVTVAGRLREIGQLENAGGVVYLAGVNDRVPTAANAFKYAAIVREKWVLRELIRQSGRLIGDAYEGQTALEDLLGQASRIGAELEVGSGEKVQALDDVLMALHEALLTGEGERPLTTGFIDLDEQLSGGFYESSLNILAARPSMGKSAMAMAMAQAASQSIKQSGEPGQVAVVSLEMPAMQLVMRMLAAEARTSADVIQRAKRGKAPLSEGQWRKINDGLGRLQGLPIAFFDEANDKQLPQLMGKLRRAHREKPLKMVVIDYLQLIDLGKQGGNREQEVSTISRTLKGLARELRCPVIALSQLSRAVETRPNHRPMLSDLRESGGIEQDADTVMFIYRDEYYNKETDQQGVAEIIVGKQRNGPVGTVKVHFHSLQVRFENLAPETYA